MKKNMSKTNTKSTGLKIAILAWGSLTQPTNTKGVSLVGKFEPKGPQVPLELCRISKDGRLTLVIDEDAGKSNNAMFAISKHTIINKAFEEFAKAEGIGPNQIGVVDLKKRETSEAATRHSTTSMAIANWAKKQGVDVVLWSALTRKWKDSEKVKDKFSTKSAINYLNGLPASQRNLSLTYVKNLPKHISTPLREIITNQFE